MLPNWKKIMEEARAETFKLCPKSVGNSHVMLEQSFN
jgi:hypothetical protein